MPLDALVSGRVATFAGDHGFGWVEAVGIRGGRVAFAGSAVELETRADPHTLRIELEPGEIAIPGLTDAHLHLLEAAAAAEHVDLTDAATLGDGLALLATTNSSLPAGSWLLGAGWDQRRWGRWPTAADLAAVTPGRPAALWSFDHHAVWASPEALAIAGLDLESPDPDGGIIRRLADGSPEGVLLENAGSLLTARIPVPGPNEIRRLAGAMGRRLVALGVVGVHDPGTIVPDPTLASLDVYAAMADAGEIPIRVHACLRAEGLALAAERGLQSGARLGTSPDGRATVGWLKLFADGTLGSQTAALLDPRAGSDGRGVFLTPPDDLRDLAGRAGDAGIASQVHAIGDAAARSALDAVEAARRANGPRGNRHHVAHLQVVHPEDVPRFASLEVTANVQAFWASHEPQMDELTIPFLGPERAARQYPFAGLARAGARVALGSDWSVSTPDPLLQIEVAVTRVDPEHRDGEPFLPQERLDPGTALAAATLGSAYVNRLEEQTGTVEPGKAADLVVLDHDPFADGPIGDARAVLTLAGGRVVHDAT